MVVVSVVNQKGGVGKTTLSVLLSRFLATKGYKTLLIDGDPQGHATSVQLGDEVFDGDGRLKGGIPKLIELFLEKGELTRELAEKAIFSSDLPSGGELHVIPNSIETHVVEHKLLLSQMAPFFLRSLVDLLKDQYDYCIVDCPPNLGSLFVSAISASNYLLIPIEGSILSLLGLRILLNTVSSIKKTLNTGLEILGIVLTKTTRTKVSKTIEEKIRKEAGDLVFRNSIPQSIRVQEALERGFSFEKRLGEKEPVRKVERVFEEFLEKLGGRSGKAG